MITYKKMDIYDLNSIKHKLINDFDDFWSYDSLKLELENDNSFFWVAIYNNQIIGFAGYRQIFDEAEIMNIAIRKDMRGKGFSSLLFNYLLEELNKSKIHTVFLEVNIKNTIALNLYKKFNFKQINIREKYYNGIDDAIVMKKCILYN